MRRLLTRRPPTAGDASGRPYPTVLQAGEVRSASIESLRAVGALGVVGSHIYQTGLYAGGEVAPAPIHSVVLTAGSGYALLLVLSGFLLFRPFARRMLRGEPQPLGRYATNRALRGGFRRGSLGREPATGAGAT